MGLRERFWHGWLRRPYKLAKIIDVGRKNSQPVLFLHGLGRSSDVWQHALQQPTNHPTRMLCFDLLGFGASPKPDVRYSLDDHASAVIASLRSLHLRRPVIIVGHSLGCLIAVRVAARRPDLVRHLVLYEMPLYSGLPDKRLYKLRLNLYFKLYERVVTYKPIFSGPGKGRALRLAEKLAGFSVGEESWKPFVRSLRHSIMEQQTHLDIKQLDMPMDVIYGSRDRLVFRGATQELFGKDVANVTAHTIRENHNISKSASRFVVQRVNAAMQR